MAVKTLFELNIGSILKGILMASDLSHGGPYPILEDVQSNQVSLFTSLFWKVSFRNLGSDYAIPDLYWAL